MFSELTLEVIGQLDDFGWAKSKERTVEVRETRKLFRLTPVANNDLSRSSRQVAIVTADTEDEARQIASIHDAFGHKWQDPRFAVADVMETSETHVFGDLIFRSEPVATEGRKRAPRRG